MSVLNAFLTTWAKAYETFGEGGPPRAEQYDRSSSLRDLQADVQSATPPDSWHGSSAMAYDAANVAHGEVFARLADLDHRLGAHVTQSSHVVTAGRRDLDEVRRWVLDAAASVPPGQDRERMLTPIMQTGLDRLTEIVTRSNGDLAALGGRIRAIGNEYRDLSVQRFAPLQGGGDTTADASGGPTVPFVGHPSFGRWETMSATTSPPGYRPFGADVPLKVGPTTGMYAPRRTWLADDEAPILHLQEGYRFRIVGTEATTATRVVSIGGERREQRWVRNVYEYQRNTSIIFGGDLGGVPPIQDIDHEWKPITLPAIAALSATNAGTTYYLPDGCGGSVKFLGGAPTSIAAEQIPVMSHPR